MIFQLMYTSTAAHPMSETELIEVLTEARRFNAEHEITGMLLYLDGTFVQVLEGEEQTVRDLYARILLDPRHHGCKTYLEEYVPERDFPEWTMGFRSLPGIKPEQLPGFVNLTNWREDTNNMTLRRGSLRKILLNLAAANREI